MNNPSTLGPIARLGAITQIAFIPDDFDRAIEHWTRQMGAGPFYMLSHIPLINTRYNGVASEVDLSAALGYWGDIQIEFILPHDDRPSIYRDWRREKRTGVHHLGIVVDDFDAAHVALTRAGGVAVQETEIPDAARAAYFAVRDDEPLIEILGLRPEFLALWRYMRETAKRWDGTNPLRDVPPPSEWADA